MEKILFVWDFHGVLEKGNDQAVQEVCNKILSELGHPKEITIQEVRNLYGARWSDYFNYLLPDFPCEIDWCVRRALEIGRGVAVYHIQANDYAADVLMSIQGAGHHNIVVSTSTPKDVKWFVEVVGLERYIDCCVGIDPYRKHHQGAEFDRVGEKAKAIQSYLQQRDCYFNKVVMVGDTEEDMKAGSLCGAITYRYMSQRSCYTVTCADYVIYDLREVLREINN